MNEYTIRVNRTTAHIAGFEAKADAGEFTMNHCGAVTRSNLARTGQPVATAAEALKAARASRSKVCKNCERAALAQIELDEQTAAAPVAQAPAVSAVVLPVGVTMDASTRVLSGPVKHMKALYDSGAAVIRDGDLVLA